MMQVALDWVSRCLPLAAGGGMGNDEVKLVLGIAVLVGCILAGMFGKK